jgi:hypothetical protein
LSPRTLIGVAKDELRKKGVRPEMAEFKGVSADRDYKKVPMHRLIARLGLTKYNIGAEFVEDEILPKEVKIMLNQHIGPVCTPLVKKGDKVTQGMMIATPGEKLGAATHSPIDGTVTSVTDKYIIVKAGGKN